MVEKGYVHGKCGMYVSCLLSTYDLIRVSKSMQMGYLAVTEPADKRPVETRY